MEKSYEWHEQSRVSSQYKNDANSAPFKEITRGANFIKSSNRKIAKRKR